LSASSELSELLDAFWNVGIRHALCGDFALGSFGIPRMDPETEVLIHKEDLPKLDDMLLDQGFTLRYRSANVSYFVKQKSELQSLNFVHASSEISQSMLERALDKPVFPEARLTRVVKPEDLIALKLQGTTGDLEARHKELIVIEALLAAGKKDVDWSKLAELFSLFDMATEFEGIQSRVKSEGRQL